MKTYRLFSLCALCSVSFLFSQEAKPASSVKELPKPVTTGGMSLNDALMKRKSVREYSDRELTNQEMSNLLWAANGITREDGRRTAPSARNAQEIEMYLILKDGVYLYNHKDHRLDLVLPEDLRSIAGLQPFTKKAPLNIIYVVDYTKLNWNNISSEKKRQYGAVDTGFIGQNVYLHCTANGMASVFRGLLDTEALHKKLNLPETKEVLYGHTVGFPSEEKSE